MKISHKNYMLIQHSLYILLVIRMLDELMATHETVTTAQADKLNVSNQS